MKNKIVFGILIILMGLFAINLYYTFFNKEQYILFLEKYVSADGNITSPNESILSIQLVFFVAFIEVIFYKYFLLSLSKFKSLKRIDKIAIIASILTIISFYIGEFLGASYPLHEEDSLFEALTAVFAIIAAMIFIISTKNVNDLLTKSLLVLLALFSFFFGMEEISWGQRIFNWETSSSWAEINRQNETNLHNLLNPFFILIYLVINTVIFMIFAKTIVISKFFENVSFKNSITKLMPGKEAPYFALIFFLLIHQFFISDFSGELFEEVFAIVLLSYSIKYFLLNKTTVLTTTKEINISRNLIDT